MSTETQKRMASRSISSNEGEGDFEVVPARSGDEFMSITSATEGEGDPYEKRADIIEVKQ